MRTLLIDNYDSFTYNLVHYLADVNGREPDVITNDDPTWRSAHLAAFDNVVLSPGPGNPARRGDFGICREVIQEAAIPLLGVCLGHQGLGLLSGAQVVPAPEPRHGRISPVLHDGTGLFAAIPSPFDVVRYHSLAVAGLSPELQATAWTADGVVMGLRHRHRPQWGVQFHPESIAGHYGHRLLANFRDLSERFTRGTSRGPRAALLTTSGLVGQRPRPRPRPRPAGIQRPAPLGPPPPAQLRTPPPAQLRTPPPAQPCTPPPAQHRRELRVLCRTLPTRWSDEAAFAALFHGGDHAYWLDSSRPDAGPGRFSIMGDASGPLARVASADATRGTVTVRSRSGTEVIAGGFLSWLDRDLRGLRTTAPELPVDFALGWVGYLGYELKAECGGERAHPAEDADAVMVFSDRALVIDHATGTSHLLALAEDDGAPANDWLDAAAERLATLVDTELPAPAPPLPTGELTLRHSPERYRELIAECLTEIGRGETYEVCLTNLAEARGDLEPWDAYRHLRRVSPAPFAAFLDFAGVSVLSTSPERFLSVDRYGCAESKPIKGTRPRGATPEEDRELVADLLTSEKDRAENLMIVDLVRNDLGRCARLGSVEAEEIFRVESYAKAHQLVSTVRARLRPEMSAVDCVRAAFPPGSMTGAPKIRTMHIIDRLEGGPRGIYSGAIGYFSLTGAADLSVVIRTAVLTPGRVRYGVGGAIIALSDAEAEYAETVVKAAPLTALTGAELPALRQDALTR
ncbi:aminodeoxychorismate synthase component I [Streptomyces sp. 796.1]|uniref:aminodeoxychorismate synthase component I n=1 Tax=Streptomyces sp. 796.1 TaxID=3163029 RepID=UPI0039C95047